MSKCIHHVWVTAGTLLEVHTARMHARAAVGSRVRAARHTIAKLTKQMSRMNPIPKSRPNACPIWTPYRNATSGMLLGCTARRETRARGEHAALAP